ncbi:hypothetical protein QR680_012212 [Steinernema hermaphroditum]|uniref:Uncharacterized protein n=1 Tax=Steinernema hermaphroditum TaxID=289476 RepID=A0AA39I393_9BILA|nr:hypothetical protein QR680_012212 [Steinernema hermaphroditum]
MYFDEARKAKVLGITFYANLQNIKFTEERDYVLIAGAGGHRSLRKAVSNTYGVEENIIASGAPPGEASSSMCNWPKRTMWLPQPPRHFRPTSEQASQNRRFQEANEISALVIVQADNAIGATCSREFFAKMSYAKYDASIRKDKALPYDDKRVLFDEANARCISERIRDAVIFVRDACNAPKYGPLASLFDVSGKHRSCVVFGTEQPPKKSWQRCAREAIRSPEAKTASNIQGDLSEPENHFRRIGDLQTRLQERQTNVTGKNKEL